jgi:hypothetical protein
MQNLPRRTYAQYLMSRFEERLRPFGYSLADPELSPLNTNCRFSPWLLTRRITK